MNKLEELRNFVADLFGAATDKTTIEKSAIVNQKIDEAAAEQTKLSEDYQNLLKDYKDVVLHTSFKPQSGENTNASAVSPEFNGDQFIADFLANQKNS